MADTYDALTSHRPYRAARSKAEAMQVISQCAGTQFDPYIVEILAASLVDKGLQTSEEIEDERGTGASGSALRL